jgi:hypothetical protein
VIALLYQKRVPSASFSWQDEESPDYAALLMERTPQDLGTALLR